ncbi:MAG: efflux transporter outer membrane subunit [Bryobacteraceae bacterium]
MKRFSALLFVGLMLTGCAIGPNYKRPAVPSQPQFRGPDNTLTPAAAKSIADEKWFDLFHDDVLKQLVDTALAQNYDVRIAAERVLENRAQFGITRSYELPEVDASAQFDAIRNSRIGSFRFLPNNANLDVSYTQAGFSLSWELDVWGRLRRLTEAARAQYLASEQARRGVITTLVADVTTSYFDLRELDLELEIGQKTRALAQDGLRLTELRHTRGVVTGLDVSQAQQLLYTATAQIAATQRGIQQGEDSLSLLLARNPGPIPRGKTLDALVAPPDIPAGLPSALLDRRPDIRQAEDMLIAANAEIGAAKAEYFPQITLTSFVGGQSRALTDLFTGPGRQWSFVPTATLPIFNAGRIHANVKLTEAQQREAVLNYQKTIQTAFREVSDSLIGYTKTKEQRSQQELLVKALENSDRLSRLRYKGGLDSFLQVLDADRNLFEGQLTLAQLKRDELLSVVNLYRALGGGWQ